VKRLLMSTSTLGFFLLLAAPFAAAEDEKFPLSAYCTLRNTQGDTVGTVTFSQASADAPVVVTGEVTKLKPANAKHGWHIHAGATATPDFKNATTMKPEPFGDAGAHFLGMGPNTHGSMKTAASKMSHAGDLGNLEADAAGSAKVPGDLKLSWVTLAKSQEKNRAYIVGKTLIVHQNEDDEMATSPRGPNGGAGGRIAGGAIKEGAAPSATR
jgi:Cu/Zn superoxide dismutase